MLLVLQNISRIKTDGFDNFQGIEEIEGIEEIHMVARNDRWTHNEQNIFDFSFFSTLRGNQHINFLSRCCACIRSISPTLLIVFSMSEEKRKKSEERGRRRDLISEQQSPLCLASPRLYLAGALFARYSAASRSSKHANRFQGWGKRNGHGGEIGRRRNVNRGRKGRILARKGIFISIFF